MESLPNRTIIDEALNRICSDKLFKRSHSNELLLRFLVDQAYLKADVKEQVIGLELFKKDYNSEQNDSKIRVAVYYLRNKLKSYYAENGKDEEIRFEIEKGQYNLSFISKTEFNRKLSTSKKTIQLPVKYIYLSALIFIGVISIVSILHIINSEKYCWSVFFNNNKPNICIVSDHFIVRNPINELGNNYTLNGSIKSEADLISFNKENPDEKLTLSYFTLFSKMAPFAIQNLTEWFSQNNSFFTIRLESELRYDDFKENNLLFIGQAKNMVLSKSIFLKNSRKFKFENNNFSSISEGKQVTYEPKKENAIFKEYAMVSFVSTDDNREALFFVSEHDIGVMATVKNFTDSGWLKQFYTQLPKGKKHFNAFFEVKGVERSDVICELIELEILD